MVSPAPVCITGGCLCLYVTNHHQYDESLCILTYRVPRHGYVERVTLILIDYQLVFTWGCVNVTVRLLTLSM